jgi:DNA-binding transcriptional ArsR family regulator
MNGKSSKRDELEVSSAQLRAELIEIKERVGALETIASISNRDVVEKFVRDHITTDKARQILKECEEPRTREYLTSRLKFASPQALDHHLNPLREANLVRQRFDENRKQTFEWSDLVRRLPKTTLKKILGPAK